MKISKLLHRSILLVCCSSLFVSLIPIHELIESYSSEEVASKTNERKCIYRESLRYDDKGIPYYDYGTVEGKYIGFQRNPVTISNEALSFYKEYQNETKNVTAKQLFMNNADWLAHKVTINELNASNPYSTYEYTFPWPYYNLESPWRSSIPQGLALQVLVKAHELTGEKKYLDTAELLLNSFFVEVKDGGVSVKTPSSGWWYEGYASTDKDAINGSRVLNAMMFAVLGIYDYYNYTKDPSAKYLFDQGILSLKNELPKYNKNGMALYDALDRPANTPYQSVHIKQLGQLYQLTGEQVFKRYQDLWGTVFILSEYNGKKLEQAYTNSCGTRLFHINVLMGSATKVIDLLQNDTFNWKSVNDAKIKVHSDDQGLDIIVDTNKKEKIYNRAYLQTQLNVTEDKQEQKGKDKQKQPFLLTLEYASKSSGGNATFVVAVKDTKNNNTELFSDILSKSTEQNKPKTETYVLPMNMTNKPIEFRFYIITEEPGSHTLNLKKVNLVSHADIDTIPITSG